MRKTQEESGTRLLQSGKAALIGGALALAVCLVLLLAASFGISQGWLSTDLGDRITVVSCVLGSFAGGLWSARRAPTGALLAGLASGAVLFLLLLTLGLLIFESASFENGALGLLCASLCGGAAAGALGAGSGGKRKSSAKSKRRKAR